MFSIDYANLDDVNKRRYRDKRAFYGKFKFFKEYEKRDSYFINDFFKKYKYLRNKYYPLHIIYGFKRFYLFTNISLLIIDYKNYDIINDIYYIFIKSVKSEKFEVKIEFNQKIDDKDKYVIECDDETITNNILNTLNEGIINNKEDINGL